jgi:hypothetical protein
MGRGGEGRVQRAIEAIERGGEDVCAMSLETLRILDAAGGESEVISTAQEQEDRSACRCGRLPLGGTIGVIGHVCCESRVSRQRSAVQPFIGRKHRSDAASREARDPDPECRYAGLMQRLREVAVHPWRRSTASRDNDHRGDPIDDLLRENQSPMNRHRSQDWQPVCP